MSMMIKSDEKVVISILYISALPVYYKKLNILISSTMVICIYYFL